MTLCGASSGVVTMAIGQEGLVVDQVGKLVEERVVALGVAGVEVTSQAVAVVLVAVDIVLKGASRRDQVAVVVVLVVAVGAVAHRMRLEERADPEARFTSWRRHPGVEAGGAGSVAMTVTCCVTVRWRLQRRRRRSSPSELPTPRRWRLTSQAV